MCVCVCVCMRDRYRRSVCNIERKCVCLSVCVYLNADTEPHTPFYVKSSYCYCCLMHYGIDRDHVHLTNGQSTSFHG